MKNKCDFIKIMKILMTKINVSILSDGQRKKHNKIFGEEIFSCTVYGMKVGNNF